MRTAIDAAGLLAIGVLAIWDIRYRKIPLRVLLGLLLSAACGRCFLKDLPAMETLAGMAVGAGFLCVSRVTGEAFGYADSILILIFGIFLGIRELFFLLTAAFAMAALFAAGGLLAGKFSRRISLPFIPFLAVSYAGILLFGV